MAKRKNIDRSPTWYWYQTTTWRDMRRRVLRAQPYCVYCKEKGILAKATIADHIIPHKGRWGMFANMHNLQGLCASCHSGYKRKLDNLHKRVDKQMDERYKVDSSGWIIRTR